MQIGLDKKCIFTSLFADVHIRLLFFALHDIIGY